MSAKSLHGAPVAVMRRWCASPVCRWFGYASTAARDTHAARPEEPSMTDTPRRRRRPRPPQPPSPSRRTRRRAARHRDRRTPPPRRRRWLGWVIGIVIARRRDRRTRRRRGLGARTAAATARRFSAYRTPFESAMEKAGITATFPGAPVELTDVTPTGSHPFTATFTAEEVTALLNVFRWTTDIQGTSVARLGRRRSAFPAEDTVSLQRAASKVERHHVQRVARRPARRIESGAITSTGATKVSAEGFPVTGDRANAGHRHAARLPQRLPRGGARD